jgi:hypothetical protein
MATRTRNALKAIDPIFLATKAQANFTKNVEKYTGMDMDEAEDTQ